tara:strand:- start:1728 stop:1925 length:198 start_codon:yes stop_codon:yes gene_type:complete
MTTQEILNTRNEKGIISLENEAAGWYAISRDNTHSITFYNTDEYKFYKNEVSFAKRVSQLLKRGY